MIKCLMLHNVDLLTSLSFCCQYSVVTGCGRDIIIIIIIIIIIKNISPCKLIIELQMRSCSSQFSNKNVFSNFRN